METNLLMYRLFWLNIVELYIWNEVNTKQTPKGQLSSLVFMEFRTGSIEIFKKKIPFNELSVY